MGRPKFPWIIIMLTFSGSVIIALCVFKSLCLEWVSCQVWYSNGTNLNVQPRISSSFKPPLSIFEYIFFVMPNNCGWKQIFGKECYGRIHLLRLSQKVTSSFKNSSKVSPFAWVLLLTIPSLPQRIVKIGVKELTIEVIVGYSCFHYPQFTWKKLWVAPLSKFHIRIQLKKMLPLFKRNKVANFRVSQYCTVVCRTYFASCKTFVEKRKLWVCKKVENIS